MAAPIGPGDWVEAFQSRSGGNAVPGSKFGFRLGGIYRVSELVWEARCSCGDGHAGLNFHNMPQHPNGFAGCQFRPIYRPRADFIEALKAPVTRTPRPAKKSREAA